MFLSNQYQCILKESNRYIDMDFSKEYIAKIIKNARKAKNMKQSELAENIGISEKHLSKIETGKNYPALDNFLRLIEILDLSLNDFGLKEVNKISATKIQLQKIINTSSEQELKIYLEIIDTLKKHI